ncbi:MAG: DUF4340 domain-containing protein [Acetatifactor sp.]|nr:DUF4340 domain-containing protein [Acetatifactor sp.]
MSKSMKQLLTSAIVLVALVVALFAVKQYQKAQSKKPQENTDITLVDINQDDIKRISYDYGGETYTFVKKDDTWCYEQDQSLNITQYMITSMAGKLAPLTATGAIENVTDVGQYGLDDTARKIVWETSDSTYEIEVGDYNTISAVNYIKFPSENTVYTVKSATVTAFEKSLDDVVEEEEATEE